MDIMINFKEYQTQALSTKIYPNNMKVVYPLIGLSGEVGELAEKIKKTIRDNNSVFTDEIKNEIKKEIGDILWYLASIADDLGITLNDAAECNINKILSRYNRNKIHGEGDNR